MDNSPFMITITLESQKWNRHKLTQVINYLTEQKGGCDRFELVIDGETIPFPNHTTRYSVDMIRNLMRLFESEEAVKVNPMPPLPAVQPQVASELIAPLADRPMMLFDIGQVGVSSYEAGV